MAGTNKFKNIYGKDITNNQTTSLKEYLKEFYIDGILKKSERIENSKVEFTYYYLDDSENINNLLPLYLNKKVSFYNISFVNNLKLEVIYSYENGILVGRCKSVIDSGNKIVCYQGLDISGLPINTETRKYFYENNEPKYTFEYDENGDCFIIYDDTTDQQDIFAWDIGDPNLTSFSWQGFEYYEHAEPIIP
ncbi:hypothetical protein [Frigoriflavimonas asaccharolytica]|uniref:Uncharacterized protein n=1 Tax=Frigoriflavimonas asaccharolytica TaxID=2735899 RepID=A0A8J8G8Q6_9FLAO|nr:hypothetical protein [Frigoriflavimonas asaccharolytica]NRS93508.1 hypothetical protein [Frigoriflavimonas asaccharolytica]